MSGGGGGGDAVPQPGDTGIWVTCARHQENKAAREIGVLFAEVRDVLLFTDLLSRRIGMGYTLYGLFG